MWISQDVGRILSAHCEAMDLDVRDYVVTLIEADLGVLDGVGDLTLDLSL